jgi:lipopolysaccharide transport protein LptA
MAPFLPDLRRRALLAVLALAAVGLLPAAALPAPSAPVFSRAEIEIDGRDLVTNPNAGTLTLRDVRVTQGPGTLIKAQNGATAIADGYQNSRWEFIGTVHIEFDGAVVDADKAIAVFADGRIQTLQVDGAPVRFSHPAKDSDQRNLGRANRIDYDAASREVRFSGKAWYSDGRNEATTEAMVYSLADGALASVGDGSDESRVKLTIRPNKRVPAPRTPDKATAQ